MKQLGNVVYPDTYDTIMADMVVRDVWDAFCVSQSLDDNHGFLNALRKPVDAQVIYETHIDQNGPLPTNVGSKFLEIARELAEVQDWKSSAWVDISRAKSFPTIMSASTTEHVRPDRPVYLTRGARHHKKQQASWVRRIP